MLILERFAYTPMGTFGRLRMHEHEWYTVEKQWACNRPYESCIPEGDYELRRAHYYRGDYDTYEVWDVPGRTSILIHKANRARELLGCIALGTELGVIHDGGPGEWAVMKSGEAFAEFMAAMGQTDRITFGIIFRKEYAHAQPDETK